MNELAWELVFKYRERVQWINSIKVSSVLALANFNSYEVLGICNVLSWCSQE